MNFEEMNLAPAILQGVKELGFLQPTEVQAKCIPIVLQGKDIMAQSKTGSGKTAAFALPMLNNLSGKGIEAVVLVPTRELAVQVALEISKLGKHSHGRAIAIYGGTDIRRQMHNLPGKNIVVATPGRFIDLYDRKELNLMLVKTVVLDEADRMLDMGFQEDIEYILSRMPKQRQTLLFSATMPLPIQKIAHRYMRMPEKIFLSKDEVDTKMVQQSYYGVADGKKLEALGYILKKENPHLAIIFCRTKRTVDWLAGILNASGFRAIGLHGNMTQSRRDSVMRQFRDRHTHLMVASDVAARGLDINGISHIINFDVPEDSNTYVHRIGRTARAGKDGKAISILTTSDNRLLENIERKTRTRLMRETMEGYAPRMVVPQQHRPMRHAGFSRGGSGGGSYGRSHGGFQRGRR